MTDCEGDLAALVMSEFQDFTPHSHDELIAELDWATFVRIYECGWFMSFLLLQSGIDLDDHMSGSEGFTAFDRIFGVNISSFIQAEEYLYGLL